MTRRCVTKERKWWYLAQWWSCADCWVGQRRSLPSWPDSEQDCRWSVRSRVMRSFDGIYHHWSASPQSMMYEARDNCSGSWCSRDDQCTRGNWILRRETDAEWNFKLKKIIIIFDMGKSPLNIGIRDCGFPVCEQTIGVMVWEWGGLHVAEQSRSEGEMCFTSVAGYEVTHQVWKYKR